MTDTEPRGSDAEVVALLRACGMEEANLDDGVRRVRELLEAKKDDAATYAATLDLEAMETRVQYFGGPLRHDATKLIAEVRRLREPTHCPGCDGFQMVTETNGSEHKYGCQGVPA